MSWLAKARKFANAEDGAVTVDMVGIISAVVAISLGVMMTVSNGSLDFSQNLANHIAAIETGLPQQTSGATGTTGAGNGNGNGNSTGAGAGSGNPNAGSGGPGNPGNYDDVGGAGETPTETQEWGSGANGVSS